jgi:hypothetical protein
MKTPLIWTINDFPAYGMVSSWSTHEQLACSYYMENNKAFTLITVKRLFLIATSNSCQRITSTERTKMTSLLVELKGMLYYHFFWVKNFMTWCQSMMTLCLVFILVSRSFLVLV